MINRANCIVDCAEQAFFSKIVPNELAARFCCCCCCCTNSTRGNYNANRTTKWKWHSHWNTHTPTNQNNEPSELNSLASVKWIKMDLIVVGPFQSQIISDGSTNNCSTRQETMYGKLWKFMRTIRLRWAACVNNASSRISNQWFDIDSNWLDDLNQSISIQFSTKSIRMIIVGVET